MKITTKLLGSYIILAIIVLLLGLVSFLGLRRVNSNSEELYTDRFRPAMVLAEVAQLMENSRVHMLTGVINSDASRGEPALENVERIDELLLFYSERPLTEEEAPLVEELNRSWDNYSDFIRETSNALVEEEYTEALNGIRQGGVWYGAANMYLNDLLSLTDTLSSEANAENRAVYTSMWTIILMASLGATAFALTVGLMMGKVIGKPLTLISRKLNDVAEGNLTGEALITKRRDEIGILEQATNKMQYELRHIIESVSLASQRVLSASEELTQSTQEVVMGADQIALTMQELASGSESQAHYTSDLSENMSYFSSTIETSVAKSESVKDHSTQVKGLTSDGSTLMQDSVAQMVTIDQIVQRSVVGMKNLDSKSGEVSKLITVIEEIAEQTNLLALNAAIEAARAGEQGKGFAVVADEVRKLSEQVSHSVEEITTIVESMQKESTEAVISLESGYAEVSKGTAQIQKTGETFNHIAASVEQMEETIKDIVEKLAINREQTIKMQTSVEEIASVSEESAAGIEQTSASAQQSNSTMQEVSASSQELKGLAEKLNGMVERFEL